jgi:hypothetical protein
MTPHRIRTSSTLPSGSTIVWMVAGGRRCSGSWCSTPAAPGVSR